MTAHDEQIERFDRTERLVHWTTAILLLCLLVTGTILYVPALMLRVGNRATIVNIHVISGLALVVPLLLGLVGPWRSGLVQDLRRLDRFQKVDFDFLRPRRHAVSIGKFNGGQKLAAAIFGGGMAVMIITGVVMRWSPPFPNDWARGATLVHDTIYLLLFALVLGHVTMALSRPVQLKSMLTGRVPRKWAERHEPAWLEGSDLKPAAPPRETERTAASAPRGEVAAAGSRPASG